MADDTTQGDTGFNIETIGEKIENHEIPSDQDFAASFNKGVPEFKGKDTTEDNETINRGGTIAKYGVNVAFARCRSGDEIQGVIDSIKNFNVSDHKNPIGDFYAMLGINSQNDLNATRSRESENLDATALNGNVSLEDFIQALNDFKNLVSEVESGPRYSGLNTEAKNLGQTAFQKAADMALEEGQEPDFVGILYILKNETSEPEKEPDEANPEQDGDTEESDNTATEKEEDTGKTAETPYPPFIGNQE